MTFLLNHHVPEGNRRQKLLKECFRTRLNVSPPLANALTLLAYNFCVQEVLIHLANDPSTRGSDLSKAMKY
jgi:hypothetical protein